MAKISKSKLPKKMPVFDLAIHLPDDERDKLGKKIKQKIDASWMARTNRDAKIKWWHYLYDAPKQSKDIPWPNSASLNIPTTRSILDTAHARILRAVTGSLPYARVEAFQPEDMPDAEAIEKLMQWQLTTQVDLYATMDRGVLCALKDAEVIAEVCWERSYRRVRDVEPVMQTINGPNGPEEVPVMLPGGKTEMKLVQETRLEKDQPVINLIPILDYFLYPATVRSIDAAIGCGYRYWATKNDIMKGVQDGLYDKDLVKAFLAKVPTGKGDMSSDTSGGDANEDELIGVMDGVVDEEDRLYELVRCIWQYDEDGDGIDEDCLFVIDRNTGMFLSMQSYPYWHGRRNHVPIQPFPRDRAFHAYSLPEIVEHMHAERNAIRNMRADALTLMLCPMLAIGRTGMRFDIDKVRWRPGGTLKVDDVNQVKPISLTTILQNAFAEENAVKENAEEVSGVPAYAMGSSPSRSRTLGEVTSVLNEGNAKMEVIVNRVQRAMTEIYSQILQLNYQYLDTDTQFAITGKPGVFDKVSREQLMKRYRITAVGNTLNTNKELQIQIAETLWQIAQNNPLITADMTRVWAVTNFYLHNAGIMDPTPYIGTEEDARAIQQQKDNTPPPPPLNPVALTGKIDEITTLALLMQADPSLPQTIQQVAQLLHGAAAQEPMDQMAAQQGQQQPSILQAILARAGSPAGQGAPQIPGQAMPVTGGQAVG